MLKAKRAKSKDVAMGKQFERELLLSLKDMPRTYAERQPGQAMYSRKMVRFIPPTIDLLYASKLCVLSIECKATRSDVVYLKSVLSPRQKISIEKFNAGSSFFRAIVVVCFVQHKKMIIVEDPLNTVKVTPNSKGYIKVAGRWPIEVYIKSYAKKIRQAS